jgi:hypothetical protein
MYVLKRKNKKTIKLFTSPKLGWWMAAIKKNSVFGATYAKEAMFLNMAKLSVDIPNSSVVSDLFCRAYGVGNKGFLPKEYLLHFIKYGYWGDIGIEVNEDMVVISVDPFYAKGIKIGDKIVKINLKKATPKTFTKFVILSPINRAVVIRTQDKNIALVVRKKIYNFTPLVHYGIYVDKNLVVTKLPKKYKMRFFPNKPIKVYAINSKRVYSFEQLKKLLSTTKNVTITFIQDGIKITLNLRS